MLGKYPKEHQRATALWKPMGIFMCRFALNGPLRGKYPAAVLSHSAACRGGDIWILAVPKTTAAGTNLRRGRFEAYLSRLHGGGSKEGTQWACPLLGLFFFPYSFCKYKKNMAVGDNHATVRISS